MAQVSCSNQECRMWTKPLESGHIPDFEMPILVPLSRQRLPSPAFPLSHSPGVRHQGRSDFSPVLCQTCSVSLHTDFGATLIEVCFLKQTRLKI